MTDHPQPTDPANPQVATDRSHRPLLTLDEFHHALGGAIGRNTLYGLVRANRIRHVRLGRKILIPAKEVTDFPDREANKN